MSDHRDRYALHWKRNKQPPRGVLKKRCSENMQQIYRRTSMPKCDFNKVAKHDTFVCMANIYIIIILYIFIYIYMYNIILCILFTYIYYTYIYIYLCISSRFCLAYHGKNLHTRYLLFEKNIPCTRPCVPMLPFFCLICICTMMVEIELCWT